MELGAGINYFDKSSEKSIEIRCAQTLITGLPISHVGYVLVSSSRASLEPTAPEPQGHLDRFTDMTRSGSSSEGATTVIATVENAGEDISAGDLLMTSVLKSF